MRSTNLVPLALLIAIAACGGGVSDDPGGPDASEDNSGLLCSASNPCPNGQFCFNGICAIGCNSDGDCADDQYCDTEFDRLCQNKTVATCPDTPCAGNQICRDGFCSTPPPDTQCTPRADGNDGCDNFSICLEDENEDPKCYSFPACPESGVCPAGTIGSVCNDDIIPNKAHICLTSLCKTSDHCPAAWNCVRQPTAVVGGCSDGTFGSLCLGPQDCGDGLMCAQALPGEIGLCQPGF